MIKKLFGLLLIAAVLYLAYYFIMTVGAPAIGNKREGGENTIPVESTSLIFNCGEVVICNGVG